jgi:hypothetical protein
VNSEVCSPVTGTDWKAPAAVNGDGRRENSEDREMGHGRETTWSGTGSRSYGLTIYIEERREAPDRKIVTSPWPPMVSRDVRS